MRIQTCSPLERVVILLLGLVSGGCGLWVYFGRDNGKAALFFAVVTIALIFFGLFGSRSTVETIFKGLDASITTRILDSLFS